MSWKTVSARPEIFISATGGDLRSARQAVKEALLDIGCHPVEQTHFGPDWRSVEKMLRDRMEGCQALIHIVGFRYGAEPDPTTLPKNRVRCSYTQLEYQLGCALQNQRGHKRFRVYTFVCPEDFPYDAESDNEPAEKRELQNQHRQAILGSERLYDTPQDLASLQARIRLLREEALQLQAVQRRRDKRLRVGVVLLLLALLGIGYGVMRLTTDTATITHEQQQQTALLQDARARLEEVINTVRSNPSQDNNLTPQQRYDRALAEVAFKHNLTEGELATAIDTWVAQVKANPQASPYDLALAEYKANHFEAAAKQAANAYDKAMQQRQQMTTAAIKAARLEGDALFAAVRYEQALAAYRKGAALNDRGHEPLVWAEAQNKVATVLYTLARHSEAEALWRDIVNIDEHLLGANDSRTAIALNNLAQLLYTTNRLSEAEPLMRRALAIDEKNYGAEHPNVARDLGNLAQLLDATNRLVEAEPMMRRALVIDEKSSGTEHPDVAIRLNNLAQLLQATNRLAEAEPLMRRALAIDEKSYGAEHPNVARDLSNLAHLLQATNRLVEAEPMIRRALAIDEKSYGTWHPDVAINLNILALLLKATNRLAEAEPMMRRALAIDEKSYGVEHPKVAIRLNNLALLLQATNRLALVEPMLRRALVILEKSFGVEHPNVASGLNNLAQLLQAANRLAEAEPLMRRALSILMLFTANNRFEHPHLRAAQENYVVLLQKMGWEKARITAQLTELQKTNSTKH